MFLYKERDIREERGNTEEKNTIPFNDEEKKYILQNYTQPLKGKQNAVYNTKSNYY